MTKLTETQASWLSAILARGGYWSPNCGVLIEDTSRSIRLCESLTRAGMLERSGQYQAGVDHARRWARVTWKITPTGREYFQRQLRDEIELVEYLPRVVQTGHAENIRAPLASR